jgi:hypothetical protein
MGTDLRRGIATLGLLCCLMVAGAWPAEAQAADESGHRELLAFFPLEAGFTWTYRDADGENYPLILARVESQPERQTALLYLRDGQQGEREFYAVKYLIERNTVREIYPSAWMLPPEDNSPVILQQPLAVGRQWTHTPSATTVMVATVLADEVDPIDCRRTVTVGYRLSYRHDDRTISTVERVFKQGLGMVRFEYRSGDGNDTTARTLAGTSPNCVYAAAGGGKTCYLDLSSLRFTPEPDGRYEVADVRLVCYVDEQARQKLIDARAGMEEPVAGFEHLAWYTQRIWFRLPAPAWRGRDLDAARMIGWEAYFDPYGRVLYATERREHWQGGRWFTIAGFEEIAAALAKLRNDMDVSK